jgi:hypothetical protein
MSKRDKESGSHQVKVEHAGKVAMASHSCGEARTLMDQVMECCKTFWSKETDAYCFCCS